jgi:hypothetical protein
VEPRPGGGDPMPLTIGCEVSPMTTWPWRRTLAGTEGDLVSTRQGRRTRTARRRYARHATQLLRERLSAHVRQRGIYEPHPDASPV